MNRSTRIAALGAALTLVAAACTQSGAATSQPTTAAATTAPATSAPATTAAESPGASTSGAASEVTAAQDATLGAYLAGEGGKSLYIFTPDSAGTSTCTGDCATAWPPFLLEAGETATGGEGVTGTFGTLQRGDGTTQVTYMDAPLYYFSGDTNPGDVTGQGKNGVWFLASPDGGGVGETSSIGY